MSTDSNHPQRPVQRRELTAIQLEMAAAAIGEDDAAVAHALGEALAALPAETRDAAIKRATQNLSEVKHDD